MAPRLLLFLMMMVFAKSAAGFHPEIVPSSVTNRKMAFPPPTWNAEVGLNTVPVGAAVPVPSGVAIFTTSGDDAPGGTNGAPAPSYTVVSPEPLSETHQGPPLPRDIPQAFSNCESTFGAFETEDESVVRSVR